MNNNYYFIKPYNEKLPLPPEESFSQILNEAYLHPFDWKGRTTRKSYWLSILTNVVLAFLSTILVGYMFGSDISLGLKWIDGVVAAIVYLIIFFAGLGQTIRRLHDVNYSGKWYWLTFVPYGTFFLLYLSLQPSIQKRVKWGNYLYTNNEVYFEDATKDVVPVPTIGQILKEHFLYCFNWQGRSTRRSYWVASIFSYIFISLDILAIYAINLISDDGIWMILSIILVVILIWLLVAQIGHAVRRLHDANLIGWWYWISAIPYVGEVLLSFLLFHPSVKQEVKWGGYLFEEKSN